MEYRERLRRISPNDPARDQELSEQAKSDQQFAVFGGMTLKIHDQKRERSLALDNNEFIAERDQIKRIITLKEGRGHAGFDVLQRLIEQCIREGIFGSDFVDNQQIMTALQTADQVSNEQFAELLRLHHQDMTEKRHRLQEDETKYRIQFSQAVLKAIKDGWLPLTEQQAMQRMERIPPLLLPDFLKNPNYNSGGHADPGHVGINFEIYFSPHVSEDWKQHVFFHEWVHQISGQNLALRMTDFIVPDDDIISIKKLVATKVGLSFVVPGINGKSSRSYGNGLNEGVTDLIALRLQSSNNNFAYGKQRSGVEDLSNKHGIAERVIFEAFFEEVDLHHVLAPTAFGKLIREVDAKVGKAYIPSLDVGL